MSALFVQLIWSATVFPHSFLIFSDSLIAIVDKLSIAAVWSS